MQYTLVSEFFVQSETVYVLIDFQNILVQFNPLTKLYAVCQMCAVGLKIEITKKFTLQNTHSSYYVCCK